MAFKRLDPEDFVVSSDSVTSTVWSNNTPSLNTFFTSSTQTEGSSGPYYLSVYQTASALDTAAVQFQIAYANRNGGGGVNFDGSVPFVSPTTTIYGQYRTLILEDENANFVWGESSTGSVDNGFYVISIERARYKQSLLPGTLNLSISSSNSNFTQTQIHLTDNSGMVTLPTYYGTQRVYQLISGSDGVAHNAASGGTGFTANSGSYGWFCPDISTILLNEAALDNNTAAGGGINLATITASNTFISFWISAIARISFFVSVLYSKSCLAISANSLLISKDLSSFPLLRSNFSLLSGIGYYLFYYKYEKTKGICDAFN